MTQDERIEALVAAVHANAEAHGTSVRCPVCNAGIGKFCRVDMSDTIAGKSSAVIKHEQRIKAAEASRLMNDYAARYPNAGQY